MRFLVRALLLLVVVGVLGLAGAYYLAGSQPGPSLDLRSPEKFVGQNTSLEFFVETPGGVFSRIDATLDQDGQSTPVFSLDPSQQPAGEVKQASADRLWIIRPIGKQAIPRSRPVRPRSPSRRRGPCSTACVRRRPR